MSSDVLQFVVDVLCGVVVCQFVCLRHVFGQKFIICWGAHLVHVSCFVGRMKTFWDVHILFLSSSIVLMNSSEYI